jgi:hypothetical protein
MAFPYGLIDIAQPLHRRDFCIVMLMVTGFLRYDDLSQITLGNVRYTTAQFHDETIPAIAIYLEHCKNVAKELGDVVLIASKPTYKLQALTMLHSYTKWLRAPPVPHRCSIVGATRQSPLFPSLTKGTPLSRQ